MASPTPPPPPRGRGWARCVSLHVFVSLLNVVVVVVCMFGPAGQGLCCPAKHRPQCPLL